MDLMFDEKIKELTKILESRKEFWERNIAAKKRKWEEKIKKKQEEKSSLVIEIEKRKKFWQEKNEKLQDEEKNLKEKFSKEVNDLKIAFETEQSKWNDVLLTKDSEISKLKAEFASIDEQIRERARMKNSEVEKISDQLQNQIKILNTVWEGTQKVSSEIETENIIQKSEPEQDIIQKEELDQSANDYKTEERILPATEEIVSEDKIDIKNEKETEPVSEIEKLKSDFEKWKMDKFGSKSSTSTHSSLLDKWLEEKKNS